MRVIKFGGTSVGCADRIKQLSKIVDLYKGENQLIVVVSALSGVTNLLEECCSLALSGSTDYTKHIDTIKNRHYDIINELVAASDIASISKHIDDVCSELSDICKGIAILGECSNHTRARLLSCGERMSFKLISVILNNFGQKNEAIDSREIIITDDNYTQGHVDQEISAANAQKRFSKFSGIALMPGFISRNHKGESTTLGRGGSDYTAALLGAYLNASQIDIWTDVSGMLTADPKNVSSAYTIESLSYEEAMELSYFGAKVIYPPTIQPALEKKIPIAIKNSFKPEDKGTLITEQPAASEGAIKGFSSISNISLITISGSGMVGVPGVAMRAFKALRQANANVLFITQSSSEHTICVGVYSCDAKPACQQLEAEFENEIEHKKVYKPFAEDNLAIIAMVGDKMRESVGVAGKAFKLLGENGINIRAIAQGATERNISVVINETEVHKALNALHDGFFLSKYKKVHLFMVGAGTVGGTMLDQLNEQSNFLKEEYGIDIRLVGLSNSKNMLFESKGIDLAKWRDLLKEAKAPANLTEFVANMKAMNKRNSIFIDNTASGELPKIYTEVAKLKIPIVASNKIMAASSLDNFLSFKKMMKENGLKYLHETNVAAGLPVLKTIEDLVASGDKILKIQAVLSGSLNYIFNTISEEVSFSQAVVQAREKGLTEPDPAIDLSGLDVRRKILILARISGNMLELDDVKKNDIIPENELKASNFDELLANLQRNDAKIEELRKDTAAAGEKLRYVAEFNNGEAVTGLQRVDMTHPAYNLDGMDNIILLYTRRYHEQPLVIKGAGAGPGVTASGVFADIMRLANM
ncbi:MAG: bifunctional aspartate kinase/homoserine dehydrogenase I [Salinivirgaceae bacterium]|nr:bifunctional aspartate kinase/homoserine dehydrogenase I [Salinivirgaceae bacterium]